MSINSKVTQKTLKNVEKLTGEKINLGRLIWAIRSSEDLSQVEFAKTLGISKQQLCDIEHGRKAISPKLAASYADKLGYSQQQFVRLALQDAVDRSGLTFTVEVKSKHSKRKAFAYA